MMPPQHTPAQLQDWPLMEILKVYEVYLGCQSKHRIQLHLFANQLFRKGTLSISSSSALYHSEMNVFGSSEGDKSIHFHRPNISFLNYLNYQKHFSRNLVSPHCNKHSLTSISKARKLLEKRHDQRQSAKLSMTISPTSSRQYTEEKTGLITIFPKSSKQREPLSLFESILFKEEISTRGS